MEGGAEGGRQSNISFIPHSVVQTGRIERASEEGLQQEKGIVEPQQCVSSLVNARVSQIQSTSLVHRQKTFAA